MEMKMHLRIVDRNPRHRAEFRVACGCMAAQWTRDTTNDMGAVTCGRCRRVAHGLWESGKARLEPVWLVKKDKTRVLIREELVIIHGQNASVMARPEPTPPT